MKTNALPAKRMDQLDACPKCGASLVGETRGVVDYVCDSVTWQDGTFTQSKCVDNGLDLHRFVKILGPVEGA